MRIPPSTTPENETKPYLYKNIIKQQNIKNKEKILRDTENKRKFPTVEEQTNGLSSATRDARSQ